MKGKVIVFIVEGASDEETLIPWIEKRLKELKLRVKVKIMSGDILTKYIENTGEYEIKASNVKGKIIEKLKEFMNSSDMKASYLKWNDILKVYYVTDIDECFSKKKEYSLNKKECLIKMFEFEKITINSKDKKFEIIFFNKNLENVIYDEENELSKEEKEKRSKEFGEKTLTGEWDYKKIFESTKIKRWNNYKESYEGIQKYFGKATNITVLIKEIEENNF